MSAADSLTVRQRHPAWLRWYPTLAFWEPWHMAVLSHGGSGQGPPPVSFMGELYRPAAKLSNPASQLLLTFEKRTLLGHLPAQMRLERTVPRTLLDECHDVVPQDLAAFWGDLPGHVARHLNAEEGQHFDALARAIRAEVRLRGIDPAIALDLFPEAVTDAVSYAALARAVLLMAVVPNSPFSWRMYCPRGDFVPYGSLSLNVDVPESFLMSYGEAGDREVLLGLNLAVADPVSIPAGQLLVPILSQELTFSTLFAPDRRVSSRMRGNGRSSVVILR